MTAQWRKTWHPVNLSSQASYSKRNGGVGGGYSEFNDISGKIFKLEKERSAILRRYDEMDMTVDISRALDILAEDLSSDNADDDEIFEILFPDENDTKHYNITQAYLYI